AGWSLGEDCIGNGPICERYEAATAFQFIATIIVSFALVLVFIAAFTPPPTTGTLGLALGIMMAVFSLFQMIAFSLMAGLVDEFDNADIKAGPTLGVAVVAWLLGMAGTITILLLRSGVTRDQEGPFRKCTSGGGGGGPAGHNVGTV
ncbi:unnamed protein product, partial [Laminaria digitata]